MNSKDLTIFASILASSYALPLLDETNELFCYRQPVPITTCDPLLTAVTGTIASNLSGLHPTLEQCYELLHVQWPFVTYWFAHFFGDFTPPASATETEEYELKTVLRLWILQFGGSLSPRTQLGKQSWLLSTTNHWLGEVCWRGLANTLQDAPPTASPLG